MKNILLISIILIALFMSLDVDAQCAMCKMIPQSNLEAGESKGAGLNKGIIYLMSIPYVLVVGMIIIFRKNIFEKLKSFINK